MAVRRTDLEETVYPRILDMIDEISTYFSLDAKLTFIARLPGTGDTDIVVSNDDFRELINAIDRVRMRQDETFN